jgi:serine-type D-Ala-D-Ala carboxypeptidase/endopeptidase
LALAYAVYRQRQAMTAAIGFDEGGMMDGLALAWVVMAHQSQGGTGLVSP